MAHNIPHDAAWAAGHATRLMRTGVSNMAHNIPNDTRRIVDASTRLVKGGVDLYLKATDPMSIKLDQAARGLAHHAYGAIRSRNREIMRGIQDSQDILQSLRHYVHEHRQQHSHQLVEASPVRRRIYGKQPPRALGPGQFEIRNHDDSDHAYMSFDDVDGWMGSTQNKDDLIQNLFKRPSFKSWLEKTYGSVDEGRVYRSLREFEAETLATMLIVLDHHS
jgi:hypothetical protein